MKTLYLTAGNNIVVNDEDKTCGKLNRNTCGIDYVYLAKEPMHVVYGYNNHNEEADAEEGDVIVVFYSDKFEKKLIIVKNEDWAENLRNAEKLEQEEKERWAKQKSNCEGCNKCENIV